MLPLLFFKLGLSIVTALFALIADPPNFPILVEAREDLTAAFYLAISIPYALLGPFYISLAYMLSFILAIKLFMLPLRMLRRLLFGSGG